MAHSSESSNNNLSIAHDLRKDRERNENKCILATCGIRRGFYLQGGKFVGTGSLVQGLFLEFEEKIHLVTSNKVISPNDDLRCYSLYFMKSKDKGKKPEKLDKMVSHKVIFKSGLAIVPINPKKLGFTRQYTSGLVNHRPFTICVKVREDLRNDELYCHVVEESGNSIVIRPYEVKGIADEETYVTDHSSLKIESSSFCSSNRKGLGAPIAITVEDEAVAVGAITLSNNKQLSFVLFSQIDRTRTLSEEGNGGGGEQQAPVEPAEGGEQQAPREPAGGEEQLAPGEPAGGGEQLAPGEPAGGGEQQAPGEQDGQNLNIRVGVAHMAPSDPNAYSTPVMEVLCLIVRTYFHYTPPRNREERDEFEKHLEKVGTLITGFKLGSLVITVKCDSLKSLEELWKEYSCGLLGKMVQDCFVTEKILKELNLAELKLKTTIDIKEYKVYKLYFLEKEALKGASSSEFHSISSTSESPHKQEELKKWEQKTKIVKTEKRKGTSPLTVVPTTGHGKELMEKEQRRKGTSPSTLLSTSGRKRKQEVGHSTVKLQEKKGMLPLPGSSTFDPEEELGEPRTKLQRVEGTSPSTLLSPSGHKRKLVVRHSTVKFQEKKAVPSSSFSTTNPEEEAVASQPHFIKSTTGRWQKEEELKRWEQNIETVQPDKFEGKMASAVAPSFRSTKETTNYARLCRLLVDVGAHILRDNFDKRRPTGDLNAVLSSPPVHAVLQSLRKKRILSPFQWVKLYPAIKPAVSSKNFDITLLMVLLRNICGLVRPATGWDTLPLVADTTLEADIVRIKCYRNTVYGHASEASVDDATFNKYWQDIQDALVRLGGAGYQSAIDDLKNESMDPEIEEHYKELLKQCIMDEVSIKERLDEIGKILDEVKEAVVYPKKRAGGKEDESEWSKITELRLRGRKITDTDVASLCQALQTPTCKVTMLYLGRNQITDAGAASLCQALQTPTCNVTDLDLVGNQITDAGVASLCQALQTLTCRVTALHLDSNQITDAGVASLCQALQTPTCKVTDLSLEDNLITDAGVASLCEALQTPTCKVTTLSLNKNQITGAGVSSLCQALQTLTCKVTGLGLADIQITDDGVASLCQALQTPTCKVTDLGLEDNQITDAGVASLCQALQTPTCKVTMLYLGRNQITDAGAASLCQALQTPTCKVTDLDLGGNQITDAGVASLCQALQTPTCKVTTLYLNKNQITDAGVASLCQALQTPTCKVTDLDLVGNQITDAGVASLRQASETAACKVLS